MINRNIFLYFSSIDGMTVKESLIAISNLSRIVAEKIDKPNCACNIVLRYDPPILTPQSPAGQGAGLIPGIRPQVAT